jgi:hypothetical protein
MDKKYGDFSVKEAMRLAKSPAGQQLFAMLKNADNAQLQKAADQANAGQYDAAQNTLQSLMSNPEIRKLLEQLGGK